MRPASSPESSPQQRNQVWLKPSRHVQNGSLTSTTTKTRRFLPRSASRIEEMEKRSHRRIRDLVALAAFQGLDANEIGCARISMMAMEQNAPAKGRIQMRGTLLQIVTFGLHRTAGPYRSAISVDFGRSAWSRELGCVRIG
jgi:hypothetical protein